VQRRDRLAEHHRPLLRRHPSTVAASTRSTAHSAASDSGGSTAAIMRSTAAFSGSAVPVLHDWRLRECDYGECNGMPVVELHAGRREHLDQPYLGGESWRQAVAWVGRFLNDLPLRWQGQRVLVIGHVATRWALDHYLSDVRLEDLIEQDFAGRKDGSINSASRRRHPRPLLPERRRAINVPFARKMGGQLWSRTVSQTARSKPMTALYQPPYKREATGSNPVAPTREEQQRRCLTCGNAVWHRLLLSGWLRLFTADGD
jgi:broad specificity phosphatase PhoE